MSLPAAIAPAILDTILGRLACLFLTGAGGDKATARQAALQMLGAFNVETAEQLRLAADIISFGLHALEALSQAADPELSLNRVLRLRGSAVSLSREAHKSQRKLDQLQRARQAVAIPPLAEAKAETSAPQQGPTPDHPKADTRQGAQRQDTSEGARQLLEAYHAREANLLAMPTAPIPPAHRPFISPASTRKDTYNHASRQGRSCP